MPAARQNKDAAFTGILDGRGALQKAGTNNEFVALQVATGTNDLQPVFPVLSAPPPSRFNPNTYILNHLQRDASGKIKLGLDLQGGTSFLVEMDTNVLFTRTPTIPAKPAVGVDQRGAVAGGGGAAQAH